MDRSWTHLASRLVSGAAPRPAARRRRGKHSSQQQQRTQQLLSGDTFVHVPKVLLLDEQLAAIAVPGGAVNEHLQARRPACDAALSHAPTLRCMVHCMYYHCRRRSWRGYRASTTRGATTMSPLPALASSPLLLLRAVRLQTAPLLLATLLLLAAAVRWRGQQPHLRRAIAIPRCASHDAPMPSVEA